jgi:hypothetical protein
MFNKIRALIASPVVRFVMSLALTWLLVFATLTWVLSPLVGHGR